MSPEFHEEKIMVHPLPTLRKKLACQFVREYGFSLAETARQLGVSTSAVARMLERHE